MPGYGVDTLLIISPTKKAKKSRKNYPKTLAYCMGTRYNIHRKQGRKPREQAPTKAQPNRDGNKRRERQQQGEQPSDRHRGNPPRPGEAATEGRGEKGTTRSDRQPATAKRRGNRTHDPKPQGDGEARQHERRGQAARQPPPPGRGNRGRKTHEATTRRTRQKPA